MLDGDTRTSQMGLLRKLCIPQLTLLLHSVLHSSGMYAKVSERKGEGGRGRERKGEGGRGRERKGEGGRGRERKGEGGRGRERKGEGGRGRERKGEGGGALCTMSLTQCLKLADLVAAEKFHLYQVRTG